MALKVTEQDRREWAEIRRAWLILVIFFVLGASRFIVEHFFGRGWAVVATIVAAAAWFVIRPWRIGLLPTERRRFICYAGAISLCGWAIIVAFEYWKHDHAAS
jgi:hypothetical protein